MSHKHPYIYIATYMCVRVSHMSRMSHNQPPVTHHNDNDSGEQAHNAPEPSFSPQSASEAVLEDNTRAARRGVGYGRVCLLVLRVPWSLPGASYTVHTTFYTAETCVKVSAYAFLTKVCTLLQMSWHVGVAENFQRAPPHLLGTPVRRPAYC